jgi:hypothetical protein
MPSSLPRRFETLNQTLQRIHRNKAELLLVRDRPDIVLHTNGSERDLRDPVKKRKVSRDSTTPWPHSAAGGS